MSQLPGQGEQGTEPHEVRDRLAETDSEDQQQQRREREECKDERQPDRDEPFPPPAPAVRDREQAEERGEKQERGQEREGEIVGQLGGPVENLVVPGLLIDACAQLSKGKPSERPGRGRRAAPRWPRALQRNHLGPIVAGPSAKSRSLRANRVESPPALWTRAQGWAIGSVVNSCRFDEPASYRRKRLGTRWASRTSNPVDRSRQTVDGFDSHTLPPKGATWPKGNGAHGHPDVRRSSDGPSSPSQSPCWRRPSSGTSPTVRRRTCRGCSSWTRGTCTSPAPIRLTRSTIRTPRPRDPICRISRRGACTRGRSSASSRCTTWRTAAWSYSITVSALISWRSSRPSWTGTTGKSSSRRIRGCRTRSRSRRGLGSTPWTTSTRGASRASSRRTVASTITSSRTMAARGPLTPTACARVAAVAVLLGACSGLHVSPLAPPPYQADVAARYDATWSALVRALARENVPIRPIAPDSGVIPSDDSIVPIELYPYCGRIGGDRLEGEALVAFTLFAEPNGTWTRVQVNSKMRTHMHRKGSSGKLRSAPVYQCASTGRFEANLLDAVRELVKE